MTERVGETAVVLLIAGALAAAGGPAVAAAPPEKVKIVISKETTFLLGPVNKDGTVNYVAALNQRYGKGVTKDNNAAVLLLRAAGSAILAEEDRGEHYKRLRMRPLPAKGEYFVPLKEFASRYPKGDAPSKMKRFREAREEAMKRPWSAKEHPEIAQWLKANGGPLARIVAATKRTRYYMPLVSADDPPIAAAVAIPDLDPFRDAARALASRAMLRLASGRTRGAWDDLMAIHRLARLLGQGFSVVDRLSGLACEGIACSADIQMAASGKPTARQIKAMLADLGALPARPGMLESLDIAERLCRLDLVMMFTRDPPSKVFGLIMPEDLIVPKEMKGVRSCFRELDGLSFDWNLILRRSNAFYDLHAAARGKTFAERKKALDKIPRYVDALRDRARSLLLDPKAEIARIRGTAGPNPTAVREQLSSAFADLLGSLLSPSLGRVFELDDRGRMQFDLARLSLALAAHKAEKGTYPAKLADLSPAYLKSIPRDLFTGKDLIYKRTGRGYLLYSVGENMKDDGGAEDHPDGDDLVVRAK